MNNTNFTPYQKIMAVREEIFNEVQQKQEEIELQTLKRDVSQMKIILKKQIIDELRPEIQSKSAKVEVDQTSLNAARDFIRSEITSIFK